VQILFVGEKMRDLFLAAKEAIASIRPQFTEEAIVLGPSLPIIAKIKGKNQCQVIIKYRNEPNLNMALRQIKDRFDSDLIRVIIDKSPTLG
jgi:primosomal protein N'